MADDDVVEGRSPDFAGWGSATRVTDLGDEPVLVQQLGTDVEGKKLGTWRSTAICGNDITSSCLYVSALSVSAAGIYAPIALLLVAGVLYLFRGIYSEVGSALPLNGGTYTVLLNTTNKRLAAGAAVLTLLSYVATAVISAGDGMHYAHNLIPGLNIFWATVGLLGLFAVLNLAGIAESASVALVIFVFHIATLVLLAVVAGSHVAFDPSVMVANLKAPSPHGLVHSLFFGFAAAMLGISGFESSANFIEEQADGVFPKTLRNMWIAVAVFNPLMSLLSLGMVPLEAFEEHGEDLLAHMGYLSLQDAHLLGIGLGPALRSLVSIDAVLVLSGAVLTSYVGVTGLMRRMALDRCLPQFLLQRNAFRGTNHYIILGFFALCTSILVITEGNVSVLAGVYTLSFLAVMALFAVGNLLLKVKRAKLPRTSRASWSAVIVGLVAVLMGLVGNLTLSNLSVFVPYFLGASAVVGLMFLRLDILRAILFLSRSSVLTAMSWMELITSRNMVYFTKGDDLATLNRAALYVLENEQTRQLRVVHCYEREEDIPAGIAEALATIDHLYPQLRIDFVAVKGAFGPELIERLSRRLDVPKNYMFIGTPGDHFPHEISRLGGVRLII